MFEEAIFELFDEKILEITKRIQKTELNSEELIQEFRNVLNLLNLKDDFNDYFNQSDSSSESSSRFLNSELSTEGELSEESKSLETAEF